MVDTTHILTSVYGMHSVPHNGFQELLITCGLIGTVLAVSFFIGVFTTTKSALPQKHLINWIPAIVFFALMQTSQFITNGKYLLLILPIYMALCTDFDDLSKNAQHFGD